MVSTRAKVGGGLVGLVLLFLGRAYLGPTAHRAARLHIQVVGGAIAVFLGVLGLNAVLMMTQMRGMQAVLALLLPFVIFYYAFVPSLALDLGVSFFGGGNPHIGKNIAGKLVWLEVYLLGTILAPFWLSPILCLLWHVMLLIVVLTLLTGKVEISPKLDDNTFKVFIGFVLVVWLVMIFVNKDLPVYWSRYMVNEVADTVADMEAESNRVCQAYWNKEVKKRVTIMPDGTQKIVENGQLVDAAGWLSRAVTQCAKQSDARRGVVSGEVSEGAEASVGQRFGSLVEHNPMLILGLVLLPILLIWAFKSFGSSGGTAPAAPAGGAAGSAATVAATAVTVAAAKAKNVYAPVTLRALVEGFVRRGVWVLLVWFLLIYLFVPTWKEPSLLWLPGILLALWLTVRKGRSRAWELYADPKVKKPFETTEIVLCVAFLVSLAGVAWYYYDNPQAARKLQLDRIPDKVRSGTIGPDYTNVPRVATPISLSEDDLPNWSASIRVVNPQDPAYATSSTYRNKRFALGKGSYISGDRIHVVVGDDIFNGKCDVPQEGKSYPQKSCQGVWFNATSEHPFKMESRTYTDDSTVFIISKFTGNNPNIGRGGDWEIQLQRKPATN